MKLDSTTCDHMIAWIERAVPQEERAEVFARMFKFIYERPEILEGEFAWSWPEIERRSLA